MIALVAADTFARLTRFDTFSLILSIGGVHSRLYRNSRQYVSAGTKTRQPRPLADAFGAPEMTAGARLSVLHSRGLRLRVAEREVAF